MMLLSIQAQRAAARVSIVAVIFLAMFASLITTAAAQPFVVRGTYTGGCTSLLSYAFWNSGKCMKHSGSRHGRLFLSIQLLLVFLVNFSNVDDFPERWAKYYCPDAITFTFSDLACSSNGGSQTGFEKTCTNNFDGYTTRRTFCADEVSDFLQGSYVGNYVYSTQAACNATDATLLLKGTVSYSRQCTYKQFDKYSDMRCDVNNNTEVWDCSDQSCSQGCTYSRTITNSNPSAGCTGSCSRTVVQAWDTFFCGNGNELLNYRCTDSQCSNCAYLSTQPIVCTTVTGGFSRPICSGFVAPPMAALPPVEQPSEPPVYSEPPVSAEPVYVPTQAEPAFQPSSGAPSEGNNSPVPASGGSPAAQPNGAAQPVSAPTSLSTAPSGNSDRASTAATLPKMSWIGATIVTFATLSLAAV